MSRVPAVLVAVYTRILPMCHISSGKLCRIVEGRSSAGGSNCKLFCEAEEVVVEMFSNFAVQLCLCDSTSRAALCSTSRSTGAPLNGI